MKKAQPRLKRRVAICTNILAPYRTGLYRRLGERFEVDVWLSGEEANRETWRNSAKQVDNVRVRRSAGITFSSGRSNKVEDSNLGYVHLNPGYLLDLVRSRPDAVVSAEMGVRSLCALLYGAVCRKPVWVWSGGTKHTERRLGWVRRLVRWVFFRWTPRWISYGKAATEYLESKGVPGTRILQIQNCVEEADFTPVGEAAFRIVPRPVMLHIGQLVRSKGPFQFLDSIGRLQRSGYEFSVVFVGAGPERGALERQARILGLRNVHFFPAVRYEDVPGLYRSADCVVFPTLEDVWGLVVNEAILCGLPVLSSVYAGCTMEIVPPKNWFNPKSPEDFDRALRLALEGQLAKARVSALMPAEEVANVVAKDIERVLNGFSASQQ